MRDNVGYPLDERRSPRGDHPLSPHLLRAAATPRAPRCRLRAPWARRAARRLRPLRGRHRIQPAAAWAGSSAPAARPSRRRSECCAASRETVLLFLHLYERTPRTTAARFASPPVALRRRNRRAARSSATPGGAAPARGLRPGDRSAGLRPRRGWGSTARRSTASCSTAKRFQVPLLLKLPGGQRAGTSGADRLARRRGTHLAELLDLPRSPPGPPFAAGDAGGATGARAIYARPSNPMRHSAGASSPRSFQGDRHLIEGPDPELLRPRRDPAERRNLRASDRRASRRCGVPGRPRPPPAAAGRGRRGVAPRDDRPGLRRRGGAGPRRRAAPRSQDPVDRSATSRPLPPRRSPRARRGRGGRSGGSSPRTRGFPTPGVPGHSLAKLERPEEALAATGRPLRASEGSPHIASRRPRSTSSSGGWRTPSSTPAWRSSPPPVRARAAGADRAGARQRRRGGARGAASPEGSARVRPLLTLAAVRHARSATRGAAADRPGGDGLPSARRRIRRSCRGSIARGRALPISATSPRRAAFQREIELSPRRPARLLQPALLYALAGRPRAVGPTLRRMFEDHPSAAAYAEAVKTLRVLELRAEAEQVLRKGRRLYPGNPLLTSLATNATG